ncbi:MAG: anti-sigma 24 factor [Proteobacteria bacterium]|nr:anti-sigma 24 factor [Pseudomonadota bacterium]
MNREPVAPDPDDPRWSISALADGEGLPADCARGLAAWAAGDAAARASWHSYHLIGDVLRSGELASPPGHDQQFLAALQLRLAAEPAPVAVLSAEPAPVAALRARAPSRARWVWPVGLAAGVMALGTALVVQRGAGTGAAPEQRLAAAAPVAAGAADAVAAAAPANAGADLLREAQFDRYLRAHRDYTAAQPVSLPLAAQYDFMPAVYGR